MRHDAIQRKVIKETLGAVMPTYLNGIKALIEATRPYSEIGLGLRSGLIKGANTDYVGYAIELYNSSNVSNLPRNSGIAVPSHPALSVTFYHGQKSHTIKALYEYNPVTQAYDFKVAGNLGFPIYLTELLRECAREVQSVLTTPVLDDQLDIVYLEN